MKKEEQRSSFITIGINNANRTVAAGPLETEEQDQDVGLQRREGPQTLSPGRVEDCRDLIGLGGLDGPGKKMLLGR